VKNLHKVHEELAKQYKKVRKSEEKSSVSLKELEEKCRR